MTPNEKWLAEIADRKCQTCLDHGYRIHKGHCQTVNVDGAKLQGMKDRREICQSCTPIHARHDKVKRERAA